MVSYKFPFEKGSVGTGGIVKISSSVEKQMWFDKLHAYHNDSLKRGLGFG